MPVRPRPILYRCPICHWQQIFAPASDVLFQVPWDECPKCGDKNLECRPAGTLETLRQQIGQAIGRK